MFCNGLLIQLMKFTKLWLPLSRSPLLSARPEESTGSKLGDSLAAKVVSGGATARGRDSWASAEQVTKASASTLHCHFIGLLLSRGRRWIRRPSTRACELPPGTDTFLV